jgi:amino acid transporter
MSKRGVPYPAVLLTALLSTLTYLTCGEDPSKVFIWLSSFMGLMALISCITICFVYLRFFAALRVQGVNRDDLHFKSPFQPYLAWSCVVFFVLLIIGNGFYVFTT